MNKGMEDASIVFFGTPQLSVWVLEELKASGIVPALVVTAPDTPQGRNLKLTPTPVKIWAQENDVPVLEASSLKDRTKVAELANSEWDLFIVAAYNFILPTWLLDVPKHGTLNVHPSLLPKMRGPSPVRSALLLDQKDAVGVSVMQLDEQIDHGPIVAQATVELTDWPVAGNILDELLFREGGKLLAEVVPLWLEGTITPEEQDHTQATYSTKFKKEDGLIDLNPPAGGNPYKNYLKFCAYDVWPGTYFFIKQDGKDMRIKITDAEYKDGVFTITRVIPEGKKEMSYEDFMRNNK